MNLEGAEGSGNVHTLTQAVLIPTLSSQVSSYICFTRRSFRKVKTKNTFSQAKRGRKGIEEESEKPDNVFFRPKDANIENNSHIYK